MSIPQADKPRAPFHARPLARRRAIEVLTLGTTSLAFLFTLAVAFGFITG
jgi:hypothetical protein